MDTSLIIQYIIIAVLVILAGMKLFSIFRKNFSSKKFRKNDSGCDSNCDCS